MQSNLPAISVICCSNKPKGKTSVSWFREKASIVTLSALLLGSCPAAANHITTYHDDSNEAIDDKTPSAT
jgi:hypothetical protein